MAAIRSAVLATLLVGVAALPGSARGDSSVSPVTSCAPGSYTVSWTEKSGGVWRAYLWESANGGTWSKTTVTGKYSKAFTGKPVGTYAYQVEIYFYDRELGGEVFDHETNVATAQVLAPAAPGTPGAITGPPGSSTPSYALAWGAASGRVDRYELRENGALVFSGLALATTLTGRQNGTYTYAVRACNPFGCGPSTASHVVTVELSLTETVKVEQAPVEPVLPPQGWVGTIPGEASADGGSASYRIPIEVPPGRAGMQPEVSLGYGSRQGNGIAGVGWFLSAASTVYRCPRTLRQDGANAPVTYSGSDRLCWSGQRPLCQRA